MAIENLVDVQEESAIKNAALSLLARREHSQQELRMKLARKFQDSSRVEEQISQLADSDMQSEERFVEVFIRAKRNAGKGPKFIQQELRNRGVSEFLIASYIYENDEEWHLLASDVYLKKFGGVPVEDAHDKAKRIRFMVSRGFSPDSVFRIMAEEPVI
ncbi:MAG: recombination regulator RecX [Agarilytica sp.]